MGALPSRETHQRGLYSHRHGRNRRNEIILIPLTSTFFPSPECLLFQRLLRSRHHRTAKYYYRNVRSSAASCESDYYCTSTFVQEPEKVEHFFQQLSEPWPQNSSHHGVSDEVAEGKDEYRFRSYSDTPEGLYQMLVTENDLCLCTTDEELREKYFHQVHEQRAERDRWLQRGSTSTSPLQDVSGVPADARADNTRSDAFLAGYAAAKRYMRGRARHSHTVELGTGEGGSETVNHTTSPAAYYIRPVPCAIASRHDPNKPPREGDSSYVPFMGSHVKILGMFGLFPATVLMRFRAAETEETPDNASVKRPAPFRNDCPNGSDEEDEEMKQEQHLLKGTMFVDKDVGDQILGNVVVLAAHMYVRQCAEAQISPRYIPMLPVLLRWPLSNIPLLQFVREMRVRLRTLLEAGTAKSGRRPVQVGLCGFNRQEASELHQPDRQRQEEEGYLYEDDVPNVSSRHQLFMEAPVASSIFRRAAASNSNPRGEVPIQMISGFHVQTASLKHRELNDTGHNVRRGSSSATHSCSGGGGTTTEALLIRRKHRFRVWVEDGQFCVWASAAYARRACLILAQQLNTTVDCSAVPEQRSWRYRGVLHASSTVPKPEFVNDVWIVGEDMPTVNLWQGDVLRCSTSVEETAHSMKQRLPLPTQQVSITLEVSDSHGLSNDTCDGPPQNTISACESSSAGRALLAGADGSHVNLTSNHITNPLLQANVPASLSAFWVRAAGGLDDSYTNFSEQNIPNYPRLEKMKQQDQSSLSTSKQPVQQGGKGIGMVSGAAAQSCMTGGTPWCIDPTVIDRREGTLNPEEVILSWVKVVAIASRDMGASHKDWVRDPNGRHVCFERYLIRRYEHDGIRFFLGVTPRCAVRQWNIEHVLGTVRALESDKPTDELQPASKWEVTEEEGDAEDPNNGNMHTGSLYPQLLSSNRPLPSGRVEASLCSSSEDATEGGSLDFWERWERDQLGFTDD